MIDVLLPRATQSTRGASRSASAWRSCAAVTALAGLGLLGACPPASTGSGEGEGEGEGEDVCVVEAVEYPNPRDRLATASGGVPDLECLANDEVLGAGTNTGLEGCIEVFGIGGRAYSGLTVSIYGGDQDPAVDAPRYGTTDVAVADDSVECAPGSDDPVCLAAACSKAGFYRVASVATHVPLVFKVRLPRADGGSDSRVIDTYTFGKVLRSADIVDGRINLELSVIYQVTYTSIPTYVSRSIDGSDILGDGIGRGVVAGEVHACDDALLLGAVLTSSEADFTTKLTYFDGDETDPQPDLGRTSTNNDGLYVFLNARTDAGHDTPAISAAAFDPACTEDTCACVSLGSQTVRVFPDAVSLVTIGGRSPRL